MKKISFISLLVALAITFLHLHELYPSPLASLVHSGHVEVKHIGAEPPREGYVCPSCLACESSDTGSILSRTEGNLIEQLGISSIQSAIGTTISLSFTYNSYNADGSRANLNTVMGFGWTHSYNIFLFNQMENMFRFDGQGRVTKYTLEADGTFTAAPGYFETLVKNLDDTFTLTQKDKTVFTFAQIPNTLFLVGNKVYRLTKIVDRNNNTTTLTYTDGNLTSITDTYGRRFTLTYNCQKKLASIIDPLCRTTKLRYICQGRKLVKVIDPAHKTVRYTYNSIKQLTSKVDKDGKIFSYVYTNNKPVTVKDSAGGSRSNFANDNNWVTDANELAMNQLRVYLPSTTRNTDGRGNVWEYEYDSRGYTSRVIAPDGATTRYTYDSTTLMVASVTDANNHTTTYEYDTLGNRTKVTDALDHITTFTYEPTFSMKTSITDPKCRVITFEYDAFGNRMKETDPLLQTRHWTYDSHGNVLTETDKRANVTTYEYDALGNRTKIIDTLGNVTIMTYDAVGNMLSRTDANNHTTSFIYDGLNRLIRETDPVGKVTKTFYDGQGNRTVVIDRNGNSTQYQYDLRQRLIKTIDALTQMDTQTYDGNHNRIMMTDKNGHTTTYEYDVQNRLIKTADALGNVTTTTYDNVCNVLTQTDANMHTTTYAYDELNRRITTTDTLGNITLFEYDMGGLGGCGACGATPGSSLVTKQTDGNGKVTYFNYDELGRLIKFIRKEGDTDDVIDVSDSVTTYTYDANNNRLTMTEPNGNTTTYEYDALNRQTKETNAAGDVTMSTYDGVGNVITTTAPHGNVTVNTYDPRDRLRIVDDNIGHVVRYTYDAVGNRLSQTDGNGNTTTYQYDPIYRLDKVTDPLGVITVYQYDAVGNLLEVTDRNGNITTNTYDDINRRTSTTDALGHTTSYTYDGVGNLKTIIDANGHVTSYDYDDINRLVRETYADQTPNMRTFTYDAVNLLTRTDQKGQTTTYTYNDLYFLLKRDYPVSADDNFTYDLSGRMLTAERGGWLVTFDYDGANRVIKTTQNGKTIIYVYDIPGRTRTVTYPGGRVITEHTDFRSRLSAIDDNACPPPIVRYTYDLGNRVMSRIYRNGIVATYTYNANDWILSLEHTSGVTRIAGFGHDYDNEGNKRFEDKRHDTGRSEAYQYDDIYRLTDYKVGTLVGPTVPVPLIQTAYDLDPVGNWNSKTTDAVTQTRMHNEVNELTMIDAANLFYDDNGNLQQDATYTYVHDEENRLIHVIRNSDAAVVGQYQYDALSRRVVKLASLAEGITETHYFYDSARIIEQQDAAGVTQATYVYGNYIDEVLTMDRSWQTFYYHQNALWSVAAITDNAANVVERYAYDSYGCVMITDRGDSIPIPLNAWDTPHSAIGNPYLFTGRQLDEETGLYYYRARFYNCLKGRFLQRDPKGYVDGMNLYEYVKGNPLKWQDPQGTARCNCTPRPLVGPAFQAVCTRITDVGKERTRLYCIGTCIPVEKCKKPIECDRSVVERCFLEPAFPGSGNLVLRWRPMPTRDSCP